MNTNLPWNSPTQLGIDDAKGGIHQRYTSFESPRYAVAYTTESTYLDAQEDDIRYTYELFRAPYSVANAVKHTINREHAYGNPMYRDLVY